MKLQNIAKSLFEISILLPPFFVRAGYIPRYAAVAFGIGWAHCAVCVYMDKQKKKRGVSQ